MAKNNDMSYWPIGFVWCKRASFGRLEVPLLLFRSWLGARSAKSWDLLAIQPCSWDALRSVIKLCKLGWWEYRWGTCRIRTGKGHVLDARSNTASLSIRRSLFLFHNKPGGALSAFGFQQSWMVLGPFWWELVLIFKYSFDPIVSVTQKNCTFIDDKKGNV